MKVETCEWIGHHDERCSEQCVDGKSYCELHLWQAYQRGTALGKRKKDKRIADDIRLWGSLLDEIAAELEDQ